MIEYASATPAGCIIITHTGIIHSTVYGSDYNVGSTSKPIAPDTSMMPDNWVASAHIILCDSDERIITSAIATLTKEGKKITTSKVALRIQRIEKAMNGMTKAPRSFGEYDGTELRSVAKLEYPETDAEKIERLDSMRGTRIHSMNRKGAKFSSLNQAAHTRIRATQEYVEPLVWYSATADIEWNKMD